MSASPCLIFESAGRLWALPVTHVVETMRPLPITPLASAPAGVLGVARIRGEATPVVDLASLVGAEQRRPVARFVTLRLPGHVVALAVERVRGVHVLERAELPRLLGDVATRIAEQIAELDGELVWVLREARRLAPETLPGGLS